MNVTVNNTRLFFIEQRPFRLCLGIGLYYTVCHEGGRGGGGYSGISWGLDAQKITKERSERTVEKDRRPAYIP
jgi:hypothetical protein